MYSIILDSFNQINKKDLPGVIFAFAKNDNNRICSIKTIEEFKVIYKKQTCSDWGILETIG